MNMQHDTIINQTIADVIADGYKPLVEKLPFWVSEPLAYFDDGVS
jgi:hypothetical protein